MLTNYLAPKIPSPITVTKRFNIHATTSSPIIINSATLPQSHLTGQSTCHSCLNSALIITNLMTRSNIRQKNSGIARSNDLTTPLLYSPPAIVNVTTVHSTSSYRPLVCPQVTDSRNSIASPRSTKGNP